MRRFGLSDWGQRANQSFPDAAVIEVLLEFKAQIQGWASVL